MLVSLRPIGCNADAGRLACLPVVHKNIALPVGIAGDKVEVEVSAYDPTKGRIVWRHR